MTRSNMVHEFRYPKVLIMMKYLVNLPSARFRVFRLGWFLNLARLSPLAAIYHFWNFYRLQQFWNELVAEQFYRDRYFYQR